MRKPERNIVSRLEDRIDFLYLERTHLVRLDGAVVAENELGQVQVPAAQIAVLMLGPGTSATQAALMALGECGCPVAWCGEEGVRLYSFSQPLSGNVEWLERQCAIWAAPELKFEVALRLFEKRFAERPALRSVEELRGLEGTYVGAKYQELAASHGITWSGRQTHLSWDDQDAANRALSAATACLHSLVGAAVLACGLAPGLGFFHRGDPFALTFDIADLYKIEHAVPVAFQVVAEELRPLEGSVREKMRDRFREKKLLKQIIADLGEFFGGVK